MRHQCWGRDLLSLPDGDSGFAIVKPSGSDQAVAMISGERMLVLPKDMPPRSYQYTLGPHPQGALTPATELDDRLGKQLQAYLQTATNSLLSNTTGVEDSISNKPETPISTLSVVEKNAQEN